eukprot:scaffold22264_cov62-Phaeocystis_antarctica.AAC.1
MAHEGSLYSTTSKLFKTVDLNTPAPASRCRHRAEGAGEHEVPRDRLGLPRLMPRLGRRRLHAEALDVLPRRDRVARRREIGLARAPVRVVAVEPASARLLADAAPVRAAHAEVERAPGRLGSAACPPLSSNDGFRR